MLSVLVFAGLTGCGVSGGGNVSADFTLLLDARPSGLHAGIYLAAERGYDAAEGLQLEIRPRGDAAQLLRRGRVQAAILGAPLPGTVCVMAITQEPRPGHFVCVTRTELEDSRADVAALVRVLQRGYTEAEVDPESAVQAMVSRLDNPDQQALAAQLDAVSASFEAGVPAFGFLRRGNLPPGAYDFKLVGPVSRD